MLPSKGYFKSLNCPFFENGFCNRPHCHFRHTRRDTPLDHCDGDLNEQPLDLNDDVKQINWATPPGQAINVSYKPTPIAVLQRRVSESSLSYNDQTNSNNRHMQYDVKERKPKAEYVPESLNHNSGYKSSFLASPDTSKKSFGQETHVYKATKISPTQDSLNEESNSSGPPQLDQNDEAEESEEDIDFEQVRNGLDLLDKILHVYGDKNKSKENDGAKVASQKNEDRSDIPKNTKETTATTNISKEHLDNKIKPDKIVLSEEKDCISSETEVKPIVNNKNKASTDISITNNHSTHKNSTHKNVTVNKKQTESTHSKDHSTKTSVHRKSEGKSSKSTSSSHKKTDGDKSNKEDLDSKNTLKRKSESDNNSSSSKKARKEDHTDKSSKKETDHKSSSHKSSRSHSDRNPDGDKSSKKSSSHKSSSSKSSSKESTHKSSHSKSSKSDKEGSSSSKKIKLEDDRSAEVNKNKHSKSSKSLTDTSEKHKSSSKYNDNKHRKENDNKRKQRDKRSSSSKENDKTGKNDKAYAIKEKQSHSKDSDSDSDDVEIISDTDPVIVIDSEEDDSVDNSHSKGKENSVQITRHSFSSSPSQSDQSDSFDIRDDLKNSDDDDDSDDANDIEALKSEAVKPASKPHDDNSMLDHRVQSRLKNRVSLGNTWRPATKKPVEILTPAKRLMIFRKQLAEKESENAQNLNAERVRIGCVPNVKLLLEEKKRLLNCKISNTKDTGKNLSQLQSTSRVQATVTEEDKDEPPKIKSRPHPQRVGADIYERQRCIELLYKMARQLVKPGRTYAYAREKCLKTEEEVWLATKHDNYRDKMNLVIERTRSHVQKFTQQYYEMIRPRRSIMFPPELRTVKKTYKQSTIPGDKSNENEEEVSLYSALKEYIMTEEELEKQGYPRRKPDPLRKDLAYISKESLDRWKKPAAEPPRGEFACAKCNKFYIVDEMGYSIDKGGCNYHAKKSWYSRRNKGHVEHIHKCCDQPTDRPCISAEYHSTEKADMQNLEGFVETEEPEGPEPAEGWGIYAVDCEMYWSVSGVELGRVSVVNPESRIVYDAFVTPDRGVTDYCTKMSGLTEKNLTEGSIPFFEVQKALLKLFNSKTILIGHSLENDLKVLKIIHNTVVDTSMVFIDQDKKIALKTLAKDQLNERIQGEEDGHDSAEDATTCIKLMHHKIFKNAAKNKKPKVPILKMRYATSRDPGLS